MIMVGVRLSPQASLSGIFLRDLPIAQRFFHVVLVRRNFITLIPNGNCQLLPNDILYIIIPASKQEEVALLAGKQPFEIKRVLMNGGDKITEMTLNNAPRQFKFTVVENNLDRARALTRNCPNCDVIHGEPSEYEVLEEAGVRRADAFVALADTSEGNILTCLMARDLGVRKTIADVERQQFLSMAESFNIGSILNKKMLMANAVFQILIDAGSLSTKCLTLPGAEVIRLEIEKGSKITKAMVKDLHIPEEITFASLIRNGKSELVTGQTLFVPGDHILVVCLKGSLQKAKKLFDV
jgi:trk system potassium uptake protein TrkA